MIEKDFLNSNIKVFLNEDVEFSSESKEKIKKLLSIKDIKEIIVLPDIHSKPDNPFPTGTVVLTSNLIYPYAIGQEIGCGIRVLKSSFRTEDFTDKNLKIFFSFIKMSLQDKTKKPILSKNDYLSALLGYRWLKENFRLEYESSSVIYDFDTELKKEDILWAIPKDALRGGFFRLGSLGGGNHFLEVQAIEKILDKVKANYFGLKEGQIIFMFHTGSGAFSKRLDNYYGIRFEENKKRERLKRFIRKIFFHYKDFNIFKLSCRWRLFFSNKYFGVPANSKEGKRLYFGILASLNYSLINRAVISDFIKKSLSYTFGKDFSLEVISDTVHEYIGKEEFKDGKFWVHRNGATKIPKDKNILIALPSFLGGSTFLCSVGQNIEDARFSINHGVGRIFTKKEAKEKFSFENIYNFLQKQNVLLFKLGEEDIREQAPFAFKDIYKIVSSLESFGLVKPFAISKPLGVLKG